MIDHENPYAAPLSDTRSVGDLLDEPRPILVAGKARRFGTMIVDYIGLAICMVIFFFVVRILFGEEGVKAMQSFNDTLMGSVFLCIYYIFFEGIWARTPGKLICGTVVVDESGNKPTFGQIVGRTLCRFIPFEPLSCLSEKGWHDSIPKTIVVLAR